MFQHSLKIFNGLHINTWQRKCLQKTYTQHYLKEDFYSFSGLNRSVHQLRHQRSFSADTIVQLKCRCFGSNTCMWCFGGKLSGSTTQYTPYFKFMANWFGRGDQTKTTFSRWSSSVSISQFLMRHAKVLIGFFWNWFDLICFLLCLGCEMNNKASRY